MALRARITAATSSVPAVDENGDPYTIDLSLTGQFMVSAEYFDTGAPAVILHRENWTLPVGVTRQAVVDLVVKRAQSIRDARAFVASLQPDVGAILPIP
jgi:hypothetical protein